MGRIGIISVDGHVKAPRAQYREYVDPKWREAFDEWAAGFEGTPDGFCHPELGEDAQWDAARRVRDMETQGVVAEVVFSNGTPFNAPRQNYAPDPEQTRQGYLAYNRWLEDLCSQAPGRLFGQAHVAFDDVRQAVADIYEAKEQGFVGVLVPPLYPGSRYFFDPELDPIWAALCETGMALSQHGGVGAPDYQPQTMSAFLVLATEHSFFSGRSMWQLILGGVFDRFPDLKVAYVETEAWWLRPVMELLDGRDRMGDEWAEAAGPGAGSRPYQRMPSDYVRTNCYLGLSPFVPSQAESAELAEGDERPLISTDNTMVGVDYPHPETAYPGLVDSVRQFASRPGITEREVRKVLYENAAELYHLDVEALQPTIDRVGLELTVPA